MTVSLLSPDKPLAESAAPPWETELFVLRGDDPAHLRERVLALSAFLERQPAIRLSDLACTLARELLPDGSRLALVAGSAEELRARLARAAERLADPHCRQIRDALGIYYFSDPLFRHGRLALLSPGEGAQYPNMLADLGRHFPEVDEPFALCERVVQEAGQPERSLRRMLYLPPDASPEERAAAEMRLRRLDVSISSVVVADLGVSRLLERLRLPVSAYAGHSAGELAALLSAGSIPLAEPSATFLMDVADLLHRQEETAPAQTLMLAVGAGREAVTALAPAGVSVAMDNCPHQSVAVGPPGAVEGLESALKERGILWERLPFRLPYHTPLFEPSMGPIARLLDDIPFRTPHTPVYSATTGRPFPADPAAIRQLTLAHWSSPVEFTRMIRTMYADGVRIFVEAGPRGNLSAFVEDILRGQPSAALPADTPRRPGLTQLNHLVGQLVAHHVPVHLDHLYDRRACRRIEWQPATHVPAKEVPASPLELPQLPSVEGEMAGSAEFMTHYLGVMEQFLDVQRTVMEAYLAGHADISADVFSLPLPVEDETATLPLPDDTAEPTLAVQPGVLVGEVVRYEPGRELVARRRMDLAEDLYVADHTLGGRSASRVDPEQHGLPVLPMTFSIEIMAECAAFLRPGQCVVGLRDIRLFRWLPFDGLPTTIETTATCVEGEDRVQVSIRDLSVGKVTAQGTVLLAEHFPEPPPAGDFALTHERPCRATVQDLYNNLFHGPLFQGVRELSRLGDEEIEGTIEVLPRTGWFRSTSQPVLAADPVLMDTGTHLMAAWHLEQPDWTGRIILPYEMRKVEIFGPPPAVGQRVLCRARLEESSARHFRHGIDICYPDGRLWCRMSGAGYWRFYLPFGEFNYFGPKDEYFLSRSLPEAVPGGEGCCAFLDIPPDLKQPVLRKAGARVALTPRELAAFEELSGSGAEADEWLFGRIAGKDAVRFLWARLHDEHLFPADIDLEWGQNGKAVARPRGPGGAFPPVVVAHCEGRLAALAGYRPRLGIALEKVAGPDMEARLGAARRAVAVALDLPAEQASGWPARARELGGEWVDVSAPAGTVRVRTVRVGEMVLATTFAEEESA